MYLFPEICLTSAKIQILAEKLTWRFLWQTPIVAIIAWWICMRWPWHWRTSSVPRPDVHTSENERTSGNETTIQVANTSLVDGSRDQGKFSGSIFLDHGRKRLHSAYGIVTTHWKVVSSPDIHSRKYVGTIDKILDIRLSSISYPAIIRLSTKRLSLELYTYTM